MKEFTFISRSTDDTRRLGFALGSLAAPGLVIGLSGELGAGKTFLTRCVAEGLGVIDLRTVTSPTYLLIQEYEGRMPVYHFDTYRLRDKTDFTELGVEEYFDGEGVCLVEWANRVESQLPDDRLDVAIDISGPSSRAIRCACVGDRWAALFDRWSNQVARGD